MTINIPVRTLDQLSLQTIGAGALGYMQTASGQRVAFSLGTMAGQNASSVAITGGTVNNVEVGGSSNLNTSENFVADSSRNRAHVLVANHFPDSSYSGPVTGLAVVNYAYESSPGQIFVGYYSESLAISSDDVGSIYAFDALVGQVSTGDVSQAYALRAHQFSPGSGVIQEMGGLLIESMNSATTVVSYAVRQNGTDDRNYWAGRSLFGSTFDDGLNIIQLYGTLRTANYTVAALPIRNEGSIAFATNGRKVGESAGAGTGVPVYYSNGAWRVFSTDAAVTS